MAKKKAAAKKAAPKKAAKAAKPAAPKTIKEALSKSGLVAHIAEATSVAAKDIRAVLASLEGAIHGSLNKKGAGSFTLPGVAKFSAVHVPARICQNRFSVWPSMPSAYGCSFASRARHSGAYWEMTPMRERTSSERLLSWVVPHVMVAGQVSAIREHQRWNSSGLMLHVAGEPPTSLRATRWVQR